MFNNLYKDFTNTGVACNGLTLQQQQQQIKTSRKYTWK